MAENKNLCKFGDETQRDVERDVFVTCKTNKKDELVMMKPPEEHKPETKQVVKLDNGLFEEEEYMRAPYYSEYWIERLNIQKHEIYGVDDPSSDLDAKPMQLMEAMRKISQITRAPVMVQLVTF